MSEIRVDSITDEEGTGRPSFPNGIGDNAILVPIGTTAERPSSPEAGEIRFNTDLDTFEGYDGFSWGSIGRGLISGVTAEFDSGSAASPSITFDGDTNTGVFNPAADTLAAATNGAERMRIDSSGQVGIGTSSPSSILAIESNSEPRISCQGRIAVLPDGDTATIPIPFTGGCIVMIHHDQDGNGVNFTSTVFAVCGRALQGYAITQLSTNNGVVGRSFTVEQNEDNAELLITNTSGTQSRLSVSVIGM